jgi:hypothetical protein
MIKEVKMFTVICDNCWNDVGEDSDYSCWNDAQIAEDNALEDGWYNDNPTHYCDECWSYDDGDNVKINKERTKTPL